MEVTTRLRSRLVRSNLGRTPQPRDRLFPVPTGGDPLRLQTAAGILTSTLWFGAVTGLVEVGVLRAWLLVQSEAVLGALQLNRHYPWMIPLAYLVLFSLAALPALALSLARPRLAARVAAFGLPFLSAFALLSLCKGLYPSAKVVLSVAFAYRLGRRIGRHQAGFRRLQTWGLVPALGMTAALGLWSYDQEVLREARVLKALPPADPGSKNVLLVVLDTVSADHMGLYGYRRDTTPRLRELARKGVVFDMARAPAPWTLPSHASIFTGHWPHELHVGEHRPLDGTYPTLAEFLSQHGYATSGFIGNTYYCNSWYGLARGFNHYEDYYEENVLISPTEALRCSALGRVLVRQFGSAYNVRPEVVNTPKDARRINRDFFRWLDERPGDRPFFTFLNYIDAHDPYLTPPGWDKHFGRVPSSGRDFQTLHHWSEFIRAHPAHTDRPPPPETAELVLDAYDDCLAALDERIGLLMDGLQKRGVLEETLVILTADHGEELGEHGLYGHGMSLYRPEIHVPLLVIDPSGAGKGQRVSTPVSPRDISATVADALGLSRESPFPGHSLVPFWKGPEPPSPRPDTSVVSVVQILPKPIPRPGPHRAPSYNGTITSVVIDDKVYIRDAFQREELYGLFSDPSESDNLADLPEMAPVLDRGRAAVDRVWAAEE